MKEILDFLSPYLAAYGAAVGTVALLLNWVKFRHTVNKDKIKLSFTIAKDGDYETAIEHLSKPEDPLRGGNLGLLYRVVVTNLGSSPVYLRDVRVLFGDSESKPMYAYVRGNNFLERLKPDDRSLVPAKSSKEFLVWGDRSNYNKIPKRIEVVDGVGKVWAEAFPKKLLA